MHESFDAVQLVKAYGAEQRETERLATLAGYLRTARVQAVTLRGTFEALLDVLPSMVNVGLVLLGAMRVDAGALTVGQLTSFIYLFTLLVFPRLIGYALSEMPHSLAGWRRCARCWTSRSRPILRRDRAGARRTRRAARLDPFTFPGEVRPAIDDVDLAVGAGWWRRRADRAGKTTLVEIVAGLVPPCPASCGSRQDRGRSSRRRRSSSPARSVTTWRWGEEIGPDLWEALRLARAEDFVAETPNGIDTVVGERGVSLSGGQRQRVASASTRAPTWPAAARRHHVGTRSDDGGRGARQPPRRTRRHDRADGRLTPIDDPARRRGRLPRQRSGRRPRTTTS